MLDAIRERIEEQVRQLLDDMEHIDLIRSRTKGVDKFVAKARKMNSKNGVMKYSEPLSQIQDQIGVRIVVYYKSDIEKIRSLILDEFPEIEDLVKAPDDSWKFGYEARHMICTIPLGIRKEFEPHINFFELQICTLFQHAWSQANHDLTYKCTGEISGYEERLSAWAASQAWGADKAFNEILDNLN